MTEYLLPEQIKSIEELEAEYRQRYPDGNVPTFRERFQSAIRYTDDQEYNERLVEYFKLVTGERIQKELVFDDYLNVFKKPPREIVKRDRDQVRVMLFRSLEAVVFQNKGKALDINVRYMKEEMPHIVNWVCGLEGPYDPYKGLYLWGESQVGKSAIAEALVIVLNYFRIKEDEQTIKFFNLRLELFKSRKSKSLDFLEDTSRNSVCLDELDEILGNYKDFGNSINLLDEILYNCYNRFDKINGLTIVTSNIPPDELFETVTEKTKRRVRKMLNFIHIAGEAFTA